MVFAIFYSILICFGKNDFIKKVNSKIYIVFSGLKWLGVLGFGAPSGMHSSRQEPTESDDSVYINQKKVPRKVLIILGMYVMIFIFTAFIVFWELFLLTASIGSCDDTVKDCFARNNTLSNENSASIPITDCDNFIDATNTTITCYQFDFQLGIAFGAVGGMLTMIRLLMNIVSKAALKCYIYTKAKNYRWLKIALLLTQYVMFVLVPFVLLMFIAIYTAYSTNLTIETAGRLVLIGTGIMIVFMIPWYYFVTNDHEVEEDDKGIINNL